MTLVAGEYEFTCDECKGDGSVEVVQGDGNDEPQLVWDRCDDCHGEGTLSVDEEEAAEKIKWGQTPIHMPAAS